MAGAAIAGGAAALAAGAASFSAGGGVAAKLYKGAPPRESAGSFAGAVDVVLGSLAARSSSLASLGERTCTV